MKRRFSVLCMVIASLPAWANCSNTLNQAGSILAERASLMKKVAAYKWYNAPDNQATAYSATQEQHVLLDTKRTAINLKISPVSLMLFSQLQMDLSKQIEAYWIQYWNAPLTPASDKPTAASIVGLDTLRADIQKIDLKLYPVLQQNIPEFKKCRIRDIEMQLTSAFRLIKGIPTKPSYLNLLAASLKQIRN